MVFSERVWMTVFECLLEDTESSSGVDIKQWQRLHIVCQHWYRILETPYFRDKIVNHLRLLYGRWIICFYWLNWTSIKVVMRSQAWQRRINPALYDSHHYEVDPCHGHRYRIKSVLDIDVRRYLNYRWYGYSGEVVLDELLLNNKLFDKRVNDYWLVVKYVGDYMYLQLSRENLEQYIFRS